MAKTIVRVPLTLFGSAGLAANFAQFGSQLAGTPLKTKDVTMIQALAAWVNGWQNAVATGNTPYLEDLNGMFYVLAYMQVYLLQEGIPEYDGTTAYFIGSVVKRPGAMEFYGSLTDANTGNALPTAGTSDSHWQFLYGLISGAIRLGGPLEMNGQKITGLAPGVAPSDAARVDQVTGGLGWSGSTPDDITITTAGKGIILTDTSDGHTYRISMVNGELSTELVS